ncbi:PREDICTED: scarecrow-like transcription factor PAT1 [Nicotiana attenuata]|uniref:Scarecrow-like transcription factor pat1 n=1 Tax=Nicotiana attenuata TaxID=49451 RepID=A0A1J6I6W3_NICAT|nr:PREDICTED: scarecrow-like transcription factor PAT1 [Nicotiana attenuata]XP_019250099.1 PREDICTED: scarecrow-like transcription factor PAT1 [Nicotiana attenuata]OIT00757.1 scarecrow-like transcription factor pat1 [Nicotiana attenuata]
MQASQRLRRSPMSNTLYYQPVQRAEAYCLPQFQTLDNHLSYINGSHGVYHSPSTASFSSNGSSICHQESQPYLSDVRQSSETTNYGSPTSGSCITDGANDFMHKLKELETVMLGPDSDFLESYDNSLPSSIASTEINSWRQMMEAMPRRDLKHVLIACAKAVSDGDLLTAQVLISELRQMVSVSGEPIQRLGAYILEGLVARLAASGSSICKSLRCKEPASFELLSYMHMLYEICPYFKFGYMSANGAIAEAMKDENRVHIIDFQIAQGSQWVTLIQAFAARPGGPPHIRVTGIDDSTSAYARGGGLNIVGQRLSKLAKAFKVPFEFHAAAISGSDVQVENLGIQPGEALAVNFAFTLHHMPDESVSTENHRDRLLRMVKNLNPKVVTLVEQESNTNTAAFFPRFLETLDYYTGMFESIDMTLPRGHKERINVEQHCLARDVVNIIACEGIERVERHELLGKWKSRFRMAGFSPYPLSSLVNATIKRLLESYSDKYRLEERDGALYLGWMNRDLVASCAWK